MGDGICTMGVRRGLIELYIFLVSLVLMLASIRQFRMLVSRSAHRSLPSKIHPLSLPQHRNGIECVYTFR